jgi:hypothetical protein
MLEQLRRALKEVFELLAGRPVDWDEDLRRALEIPLFVWRGLAQTINLLAAVRSLGIRISPEQMDRVSSIQQIIELLDRKQREATKILPPYTGPAVDPAPAPPSGAEADPSPGLPPGGDRSIMYPTAPWTDDTFSGSPERSTEDPLFEELAAPGPFSAPFPGGGAVGGDRFVPRQPASVAHGEATDDRQTEIKLVDHGSDQEWRYDRPICLDRKCALDITIKPPREVRGMPAPAGRQSVNKPAFSQSIELLVKVSDASIGPVKLRIENPFRTLVLPPEGASKSRRVPFTPYIDAGQTSESGSWRAKLNVQIFYRLNLIDALELNLAIGPADSADHADSAPAGADPVHSIRYPQQKYQARSLGWLGDDVEPRAMVIYIASEEKKLSLDFTIFSKAVQPVQLSAVSFISGEELADLLLDYRAMMTQQILNSFDGNAIGSEGICEAALLELAKTGNRAWRLLFDNNAASDSLVAVGNYLRSLRLPDRSAIQIVLRDTIADFVFPWSILYDRPYPDASHPPEWQGFWGARYQIEQIVDLRGSVKQLAPARMDYAFLPWDSFPQAQLIRDRFSKMKGMTSVRSMGEVRSQDALIEAINTDAVNFYCFFCHGHMKAPADPVFAGFLQKQFKIITDIADKLDKEDPATPPKSAALKQYVIALKEMLRSSLTASDHTINLDEEIAYQTLAARLAGARFESQPIVFLNMCQSAQFFPGVQENFAALFLKLKAATVIGTECEISPALGEAFAGFFIDHMVETGSTAGEALLDARNKLFERKNPLGLVYTLYGHAGRSLVPKQVPVA